jgi:hypothetical protein
MACNSFAATIKWLDVTHKKAYRIDTKNQILEVETTPEQWQAIGKVSLVDVDDFDIPPYLRFQSLPTNKPNQSYLLADCTNQVYLFDFEKMQLQRIDKTYYRGYNCLSTRFLREGIIYCFGGYGMFRTNNLMTYFQKETKEWIALNPANDAPKSIHLGLEGYSKEKDVFFSGLNYFYSDSENKAKSIYDFGFYTFDFKTKLWEKLGVIEQESIKYFHRDGINRNFFWNGKYFVVHYFQSPFSRVIIIDPIKNEVYQWDDKEKILGTSIASYETEFAKEYVLGDSLYSLQVLRSQKGVSAKNILSIEQMKQKATFLGKLYVSENQNTFIYALIAVGLAGITGYWFFQKKKKSNNENNNFMELNDIEKKVFDVLFANKQEGGLSAEQLNEMLEISSKSIENQRKLRSDFLKSFEFKLSQIYQISTPVERIPSKIDKRMLGYALNTVILEKAKFS